MSNNLWNAIKLSPVLFSTALLVANGTLASEIPATQNRSEGAAVDLQGGLLAENQQVADSAAPSTTLAQLATPESTQPSRTLDQINPYTGGSNSTSSSAMDQVTSVSQLTDVDPTSWAFQALQSLVERYGCIEGYPDRTYRGNRAMTRYEFAAGLNACLNRVNELIAAATADLPSREDIATIQRLQEEFAAELATLRGRVDVLEARTTELEANQFSTTTKLRGEAIFALAQVFGDERAVPSGAPDSDEGLQDNTIFADRVRLNFDTSFSGKDLLRTRLQANNITSFNTSVTGTNMTRLSFDGNNGNDIQLDDLYYRFPIGKNVRGWLIANSGEFNDIFNTVHPFFESSGSGAISRFGRFNPIYKLGDGGAGGALNFDFGAIGVDVGYLALPANNPADKNGLFDGEHAALAQVVFFPKSSFNLGLTYARYYSPGTRVNVSGGSGSTFALRPFGNVATSSNSFGAQLNWRISKNFLFGGWFGYTMANAEDGAGAVDRGDDATIINYAVNLGFPDLGAKGNFLGLLAGVPPKVTDNDFGAREDDDTSYHIEAFYRFKVSDNISITPGAFVILNPEHNDNNDTIYVGTIRTTFSF